MVFGTREELCTFSFVSVFEPKAMPNDPNSKPKYSVQVMIPKTHTKTLQAVNDAIEAACKKGISKNMFNQATTKGKNFRMPFRDGDQEAAEHDDKSRDYLKGYMFFNASANENQPPNVVDSRAQPIIDRNQFYSGCKGVVDVNFYPYTTGSPGVAAGLNSVMKLADGERMDGRVAPDEAFKEFITDDNDSDEGQLT